MFRFETERVLSIQHSFSFKSEQKFMLFTLTLIIKFVVNSHLFLSERNGPILQTELAES